MTKIYIGKSGTSVFRYIKSFGLYNGIKFFINYELAEKNKIKLPNIKHSFYLRKNTTDLRTFVEIFLHNTYEIYLDFTPKVIVDAGANIGLSSIFFMNKFPESKIYAIEPDLSNYQWFQKNTVGYPNIKSVRAGLWHKKAKLDISAGDAWGLTVCGNYNGCILGISIMDFMEENGYRRKRSKYF